MALTESEVKALVVGCDADRLVSGKCGWRLHDPSTNVFTAWQLEEIVLEEGDVDRYRLDLKALVQEEDESGLHFWWLLAHATPLQRCKAYLLQNLV